MSRRSGQMTFIIFSLVGVFNTLFDLALYYVLVQITHSIIIANIAATSAALVGSYLINSRLTFKSRQWTTRSFVGFLVVTLFGLWVLQTAVISVLSRYVGVVPDQLWALFGSLSGAAMILAPKIVATGVTLVWNFLWYSKVIFKTDAEQSSDNTTSARA